MSEEKYISLAEIKDLLTAESEKRERTVSNSILSRKRH